MSVQKYVVSKQQGNFTTIPNKVLQNLKDMAALGLYVYLSSLPSGWEFYKKNLQEHCNIGVNKLDKLLKILANHNLVELDQIRDKDGRFSYFKMHVKDGMDFKIIDLEKTKSPFNENRGTVNGATENSTYKRNIEKEKKEKEKKDKAIPNWLNEKDWQEFKQFRKEIKKPLTDLAEDKALKALEKLKSEGQNPAEVIVQSIVNGWSGLFPVKNPIKANYKTTEMKSTVKEWMPGNPDYDRVHGL